MASRGVPGTGSVSSWVCSQRRISIVGHAAVGEHGEGALERRAGGPRRRGTRRAPRRPGARRPGARAARGPRRAAASTSGRRALGDVGDGQPVPTRASSRPRARGGGLGASLTVTGCHSAAPTRRRSLPTGCCTAGHSGTVCPKVSGTPQNHPSQQGRAMVISALPRPSPVAQLPHPVPPRTPPRTAGPPTGQAGTRSSASRTLPHDRGVLAPRTSSSRRHILAGATLSVPRTSAAAKVPGARARHPGSLAVRRGDTTDRDRRHATACPSPLWHHRRSAPQPALAAGRPGPRPDNITAGVVMLRR